MKDYIVVDVRDDDYRGGNIANAVNSPSGAFLANVDELVKKTKVSIVVRCLRFVKLFRTPIYYL
jgi:rhodanese-related sulfurtransferase